MKAHIRITTLALAILALAACSKAPPQSAVAAATAEPAAPLQQRSAPPCGPCQAGFIGLQLTGLASFSTTKQDDLRIRAMAQYDDTNQSMGASKNGKLPITATADWWTDGGTLRISASAGSPMMNWSPFGDKKRDMSAGDGVKIPAGWYYSYVTCSTSRCENVSVTVDGKPVVPYYMPPRQ